MRRLALGVLLAMSLALGPALRRQDGLADQPPFSGHFIDDGAPLPDEAMLVDLARHQPIAFVENCLRRCDREVYGYTTLLAKHERINGKLLTPELIRVSYRTAPHSVLMHWLEGARQAGTVLYVAGENNDRALIRPAGLLRFVGIVERDPEGADARENARYLLTEFGIRIGMERTLTAWHNARRRGSLQVTYLGTRPIPELNYRVCHVLHRTGYEWPEDDGITDLVLCFDRASWLQVGSVLRGAGGELIASYYMRDLKLNPTLPPSTFTRQSLQ